MADTQDQAEEAEVVSETGDTPETSTEQSETTDEGTDGESKEAKTYDVLGRKLAPDELYEEYTKTQAHITKMQQEAAEREAKATEEAESSIADNELLKDVDPNVKEALIQMMKPEMSKMLQEREAQATQKAQDEAFHRRLGELETKYSGKDGLPKFDRSGVILAMQEQGNEIFDPEIKFMVMNREKFDDHLIKQALKDKQGGPSTESTGGSTPRKPDGKTPRTWAEAGKAALGRL